MKIVKGIGKAIKGIVGGVKKVFKKITSSKIGKAILIGATIYLGGAALGAWKAVGPFARINGVLAGGGQAASVAATGEATATGAVTKAAETAISNVLTTGGSGLTAPGAGVLAPGVPVTAATGATAAQSTLAAQQAATASQAGIGTAVGETGKQLLGPGVGTTVSGRGNVIQSLMKGAGEKLTKVAGFVDNHPYASAMMLNAAASALSPNEMDMMQSKFDREDSERERREKNLDVADIDLGISPSRRPLRRISTGMPVYNTGLLNSRLAGT